MARENRKIASLASRWRAVSGVLALAVLGVSAAMGALKLKQYVTTDPQFLFSRDRRQALAIEGLRYASRSKVERVFAPDFERSVFSIPLAERRRRLLGIDWVEDAAISRIWPDRLVVYIHERKPVAFVFSGASVLLIDAQGVLLDPPGDSGTPASFTFPVLSGVRADESEALRRVHVRAMLRLEEDLGAGAKDISEVNAADPDDLRVVVRAGDRSVELMLGGSNFAARYRNFLAHYPEIRRTTPDAKSFDLRLDDRITARRSAGPWQ